jgi:hypothetical protein
VHALMHAYTYKYIHKDTVYMSLRTQCVSIRQTTLLMLYGETATVCCENHVNTKYNV